MHRNFPLPYCSQLMNKGIGTPSFFETIEKELPTVFSRETASKAIGGLISPRTMANEDSRGVGPSEKVRIGNRVGYTKASFMVWLRGKVRNL